ncbi:ABC transport system periplasmic substrate binding protein [Legionella quinlivanii]|uniref:ABC transport system periplasmic substrate binding protein n=1 Tax=Legionella quinlivanii TaxID=45073 RepID=A0A0W0Y0M8_9GAMM|nr:MlaD family protein [Legionella quinlivanii]KTD50357.1 ABC transport system periplasmic substrate binding protein [Legionella quinlivanii]MCW8449892.1 MlaD family protein [Legionella quinlivanii]SEF42503.1 phospholipid/cholesterol/gamma-HCH transport system substrate-binding protein [Legionella quinlivanii DSM 21216]STY11957.1 ABC transport system periplasmic substrate binding protein [Legionella quinlivanii]
MEAKTNYTIVGLTVVILTAALLASALWLSVGFDQKKYKIYAVYIHEAVSGLSEDSPVKYNGVPVGSVAKIELSQIDPQQVKILLNIEEGTPITTSTTATLISQGITGTTYVGLSASSSELTPLKKIPKEPYPIIPAKPSLFYQLDSVLKEVAENVNGVTVKINKIFDDENALYIKNTLKNLEGFSDVVAKNNETINNTLKSTDVLTHNLAQASKDLPAIIREVKQGVEKLNVMTERISEAGEKVSTAMDAGKTTLDKISQQTIPPAVVLIRRLNTIAANLEQVSNLMRQNPAVVVRGTATPKAGPGE